MIRRILTILLAVGLAVLLSGSSSSAASSWPTAPVPPLANDNGTSPVVSQRPADGSDRWISGFGADNNLLPMVDFDTTMGSRETQIATEMLTALNNERTARGLRPLAFSQEGTDYAVALTHRNAAMDMVAHSDELGYDALLAFFPDAGYGTTNRSYPEWAGENVSGADGASTTSGDALLNYMNSAPHRTSLLGGNYDAVGIGVACVVYHDQFGIYSSVMTAIVPVKTQDLPPSYEDPSYGPYPQGNPAPAGAVTPANSGVPCFDEVSQTTGGIINGTSGGGTNPGGGTPTTSPKGSACLSTGPAGYNLADPVDASVYRLYCSYFLRLPEAGGWNFWTTADHGMTLRQMSEFFSTSDEFKARYGTLTNTEFVRQTYLHVMEREPDQGGYDFWVGKLNQGMSRGELTVYFSDSPEFRALTHTN